MHSLRHILLLACTACAITIACTAAGRAQTYRMGVENIEYMPHYSSIGGEYVGFARELFDRWAEDRGFSLVYETYPIRRLNMKLVNGSIDFKYPDNPKWRGKDGATIHYSKPVIVYEEGANVLPENYGTEIRSLAHIRGFTPVPYLERIERGRIAPSEHTSMHAVLQFVVLGRADAAYGERHVVQYFLRHMLGKPGTLVFDETQPNARDFFYLSSTSRSSLVEDFNSWMKANKGTVAKLKAAFRLN